MLPAIILITAVILRMIDVKLAIALIILFHIGAFWWIICFENYSEVK